MDVNFAIGFGVICYLVVMLVARSKRPELPVWSIMSFAMFIVVISGIVRLDEIDSLINLDVILFLIGMFSIVSILDYSGVIDLMAMWFVTRFKTRYKILLALSLVYGLLSAYTVNDALTLMGTPVALSISRAIGVDLKVLLLLIAFSITIGSVMSPVGNPQNMLISSSSGMPAPFIAFTVKLAIPTIINLLVTTAVLIKLYRVSNAKILIPLVPTERIKDRREAILGVTLFTVTIMLFVLNDLFETYGLPHVGKRGLIPFVTASLGYILSKKPRRILEGVGWGTIVFFISMFITMNGIWRSGVLTPLLNLFLAEKSVGIDGIFRIAGTSIIVSQFLSNVPFTSLYIEYLRNLGYTGSDVNAWITLAMSSTIAGNFTLLGAASNIILLEVVEQRGKKSLTFIEFFKAGSIVTITNLFVYIPFIVLL
ncbi:MAG: SLC13 family permease [Thermosphaera sp.]